MATLEIIGSPREGRGGSGFGFSYWQRFHQCAKRGTLSDVEEEQRGGDPEEIPGADPAAVGEVLHKLSEWWHSGTMTLVNDGGGDPNHAQFQLPDGVAMSADNPAVEEAWRVFRWYAHHHPADFFGEVVAVELPFSFMEADGHCPVGVTPWTGRIDMVVRLSAERADALSRRILQPLHAGIYLLDHKSKGSKPSAANLAGYNESLQFHGYMMAWDVLFAANLDAAGQQFGACNGMITNFMVRHKTQNKLRDGDSFSQHVVPFPTPDQQRAVRNWYATAKRRKEEEGEMHADASFCEGFGRMCGHYLSGACKRY